MLSMPHTTIATTLAMALMAMAAAPLPKAAAAPTPAYPAVSAAGERHGLSLESLPAWSRVDQALSGERLEVFIVPHTHDDTGWLETVDGYYEESVKWILDTATAAVERDQRHRPHCANPLNSTCEKRVFSYVEIDFFEKWWAEQGEGTRNITRKLVAEGRLEFNVAGWCMNDEASVTYSAAINQMTEGHQFVLREFGPLGRASVGWHVDPFGHSASIASLWSGMGFDAFGLERIDWREKDRRKANQELEFVWRGSDSLGEETQIFAHILDSHYNTPPEMAYDGDHGSSMRFTKQSGGEQADAFAKMARTRSAYYKHNLLMIPYGDDFMHTHAFRSFDDMDDLMNVINTNPQRYNMTVRYAGLKDYVHAVHALDLEWPVLDGAHPLANGNRDFHPYTTDTYNGNADVWSGYYSSRPKLKGYIRSRENFLRHSELLMTAASLSRSQHNRGAELSSVTSLRRAVGVGQHHDAITGTEKDAVTASYMNGLSDATAAVNNATSAVAARLLQKPGGNPTAMTADPGLLSLIGEHEPCGGIVSLQCVSWRQTSDCDATGHHLEPRNDKPCSATISSGQSGFCECSGGVKRNMVGCTHEKAFTCNDICHNPVGKCFGIPPPAGFNTTAVVLHNTLGWEVTRTVRLVLNRSDVIVLDSTGSLIPSQLNPLPSFDPQASAAPIPSDGMQFFPEMSNALDFSSPRAGYALYFAATIPAASLSTVFVTVDAARAVRGKKTTLSETGGVMENRALRLHFNLEDGLLSSVLNKRSDINATVKQQLWQYRSGDHDGAYIFRPAQRHMSGAMGATPPPSLTQSSPTTTLTAHSLSGEWDYTNQHGQRDVYRITQTSSDFSVIIVSGLEQWHSATGNILLNNDVDIKFNTGVKDTGKISVDYNRIVWNDKSVWTRSGTGPPAPPSPAPGPGPTDVDQAPVSTQPPTSILYTGPIVDELQQAVRADGKYGQTYRLFHSSGSFESQAIELTMDIGPLDPGHELVARFDTDVANAVNATKHISSVSVKPNESVSDGNGQPVLWTDDNALEFVRRTTNLAQPEPIPSNFYPIAASAFIRDESAAAAKVARQFAVLTDRAHGVASLSTGELEVMLHRRCDSNDNKGNNENLDETDHITASMLLLFDDVDESAPTLRRLSIEQNFAPTLLFAPTTSVSAYSSSANTKLSPLIASPLPPSIHLLSLDQRYGKSNATVLRLQHVFEDSDRTNLSVPVTVDLEKHLHLDFHATSLVEMSLSANLPKTTVEDARLRWRVMNETKLNTAADGKVLATSATRVPAGPMTVTLRPREIKTFLLNAEPEDGK